MPMILDERVKIFPQELVRIVYDAATNLDFPNASAYDSGIYTEHGH